MTTPELLPCPFCGGEARSRIYEDDSCNGFASAECVSCGADIRLAVFWMDNGEKEQAEAIAAWNTRAPLSPAVLAALPKVQALIRAETERCADLVEAILKQDAKAAEPHNTEIASERWEYAEQLPAAIREAKSNACV